MDSDQLVDKRSPESIGLWATALQFGLHTTLTGTVVVGKVRPCTAVVWTTSGQDVVLHMARATFTLGRFILHVAIAVEVIRREPLLVGTGRRRIGSSSVTTVATTAYPCTLGPAR